jgi:hypothetical protein
MVMCDEIAQGLLLFLPWFDNGGKLQLFTFILKRSSSRTEQQQQRNAL